MGSWQLRKADGGLWVGGRIHTRDGRIWFSANGVNRAFHSNLGDHSLRLVDVVSVYVRPGVLTKIIDVSTNDDLLTFSALGARAVANTVRSAVDQARGQPRRRTADSGMSGSCSCRGDAHQGP